MFLFEQGLSIVDAQALLTDYQAEEDYILSELPKILKRKGVLEKMNRAQVLKQFHPFKSNSQLANYRKWFEEMQDDYKRTYQKDTIFTKNKKVKTIFDKRKAGK